MTHDRPYRARLSDDEARDELLRNSGTQFDPDLIQLFVANIDQFTAGAGGSADPFTRGLHAVASTP